jgi:hypothetical protein
MEKKEFYGSEIIRMISEISDLKFLEFMYHLMISFKNKWGI